MKRFNITGVCNPAMHYMVDTSARIERIVREYIEPGEYFVINRARQFGKTTTLRLLGDYLQNDYLTLQISFEASEGYFEDRTAMMKGLISQLRRKLAGVSAVLADTITCEVGEEDPIDELSARITNLCKASDKPIVLMIDEVDRATDYAVFASLLGMFRARYLERETPESHSTFHSVILAGVHDIKNLKAKIRHDADHAYNSPWNIAASFDIDMSFSPSDIATMLDVYEADHNTGMDVSIISERIYEYTSGYPFLVSLLCKLIHDHRLGWTQVGLDAAARRVLLEKNTLFDDVIKNLQNHKGFSNIVERIVLEGKTISYNPDDPNISIGIMYGIFSHNDCDIRISSQLFSTRLMNYYVSVSKTSELASDTARLNTSLYIKEGVLDFDRILERFCVFMHDEYRYKDTKFFEHEARCLLIAYIKPIINGVGNYFLEPEIRDGQKIDLLVLYKEKEYIVETKIWRGEAYEQKAFDQIASYVNARHGEVGYVVSFCDMATAPRQSQTFMHNGIEVHEVVVAYKDDTLRSNR